MLVNNNVPTVSSLTLTTANTEYSIAIPQSTKQLVFQCQPDSNGIQRDLRYAFVTGKVATPTAPYMTLLSGQVFEMSTLNMNSGLTLYLASGTSSVVVQLEFWDR